jgi:hypothetical protein
MRVRTSEEIKKKVISNFQKDFPGEKISDSAFSIYILDEYCRLMEIHEFYRHMVRTHFIEQEL